MPEFEWQFTLVLLSNGVMIGLMYSLIALGFVCVPLPLAAQSPPPASTIGDLKSRTVGVHKDAAATPSVEKAMENYRRFLELQNTDPKLRAEAMRRLGDLNLDAGELTPVPYEGERSISALDSPRLVQNVL